MKFVANFLFSLLLVGLFLLLLAGIGFFAKATIEQQQTEHVLEIERWAEKLAEAEKTIARAQEQITELEQKLAEEPEPIAIEVPDGTIDAERRRRLEENQRRYNKMLTEMEAQVTSFESHRRAAELAIRDQSNALLEAQKELSDYNDGVRPPGIRSSKFELEKKVGERRVALNQAELNRTQIEIEIRKVEDKMKAMNREFEAAQAEIQASR